MGFGSWKICKLCLVYSAESSTLLHRTIYYCTLPLQQVTPDHCANPLLQLTKTYHSNTLYSNNRLYRYTSNPRYSIQHHYYATHMITLLYHNSIRPCLAIAMIMLGKTILYHYSTRLSGALPLPNIAETASYNTGPHGTRSDRTVTIHHLSILNLTKSSRRWTSHHRTATK